MPLNSSQTNSAADAMSAAAESFKKDRQRTKELIQTLKTDAQTRKINPIKAGKKIGELAEQVTAHRKTFKKLKKAERKLRM
ncbi:hypothetical protein [Aquimarina sp. RZ0]|uniref:hypothetical protein n=1 Tax=Aquimarina sp. RZ0 TaxID=2607730 RepID=UPI0011F2A7D3|nr:hypothetical protein [Aquimarina sp. RZ0]KAA1243104.1 hypothetical protein F0000_22650 [Aquimarina sp. RZ0]